MNPDLIDALEKNGDALPPATAERLRRIAARELVSVDLELRSALYGGVLLVASGIGWLLKENLERIGPAAVALALGLVAALCFVWVARHSPAFTWGPTPAAHFAFEHLLLLGVLVGVADLGYVESQFTPLGPNWPWHLLLVSLAAGVLAFRYDSRLVFSLALSSFAAWRGVSVSLVDQTLWQFTEAPGMLRGNALASGALFVLFGYGLRRAGRKAHFEPVATHLGWFLGLSALGSGIGGTTTSELGYSLALLGVGATLARFALRARRFGLFALGVVGGYAGLSALFASTHPSDLAAALWYCASSLALLIMLVLTGRRLKEQL
jgi:hypothetical protein